MLILTFINVYSSKESNLYSNHGIGDDIGI